MNRVPRRITQESIDSARELFDGKGLKCCVCGCRLFRVVQTERSPNDHAVYRWRKCMNCRAKKRTREEDCH